MLNVTFCDVLSGRWQDGDEPDIAGNMRGGYVASEAESSAPLMCLDSAFAFTSRPLVEVLGTASSNQRVLALRSIHCHPE